jgi:transcriptional regulator with XRE-family HTH domain
MINEQNFFYFSKSVKQIRILRGFNTSTFHSLLLDKVTLKQYINIENGTFIPNTELAYLIANKLEIQIKFLIKPILVNLDSLEFKNLDLVLTNDHTRFLNFVRYRLEKMIELEIKLKPKSTGLKILTELKIQNEFDIEKAASKFREILEIGFKSIANLTRILEEDSIKIIHCDLYPSFESTSTIFNSEHFIIIINNDLKHYSIEDTRLFLLKEVANLFLNLSNIPEENRNEFKDRFAHAVLLPQDFVSSFFGDKRDCIFISELRYVNSYFGISPVAILKRISHLKIISDWKLKTYRAKYNKHFKNLKTHGYKGTEDLIVYDNLLVQAIVSKKITEYEAAYFSNQNLEDFQKEFLDKL